MPPDLQESVDAFLAHLSLERGAAKLTTEAYESDLVRFAAHCGRAGRTNWMEVSLADVDSWTRALDRKGQPITLKLTGPVEAWYEDLGENPPVARKG